MSPQQGERRTVVESFPRVSGDEPLAKTLRANADKFSPRERG